MVFQEPKVEFVQIDLTIDAANDGSTAGIETCTGDIAPSNTCASSGTFWL